MRVWIIEGLPDWEQGTRHGIFASPHAAWDTLFGLLDGHVLTRHDFTMEVQQRRNPGENDVVLDFVYNSNDRLRLSGEYVKRTGDPTPTNAEAQEFQEVAALAASQATKIEDFVKSVPLLWDVRRTDALTAVWKFERNTD